MGNELPVFRVCLINMPFAALDTPSLALTRLSSVLLREFGSRVSTEIHYLNFDLAMLMGVEFYTGIAESVDSHNRGLGEWFFRQAAFPELSDNSGEYFGRYYPQGDGESEAFRKSILRYRGEAERLLDELIAARRLHQADLVGFTSVFFQNTASFAMARKIKKLNPDTVTVIGGANCETPMGEEIACHAGCMDFVFSGPALKSFPELVGHLLGKETARCHAIAGVLSNKNCTGMVPGGLTGEEEDIDSEIELDYDSYLNDLEESFPGGEVEPRLLFRTSRGCWWGERSQCTFCGLNGTTLTHRAMSPERAVDQFRRLLRYYPRCRSFKAVDNLMPRGYVQSVFPRLQLPAEANIFYEVRADLTAEDFAVLQRAGVKQVQPGLESLATSTLRLMGKGTTVFRNLQFLVNCVRFDVEPVWNLLVGFPGEGEDVYRKYIHDIPLLAHLPPPSSVFPVRFDRYSPYFNQAGSYGLDLHPYHFYELVYPFPIEVLNNLAYSFMDANFGADYCKIMVRWIDRLREQIGLWRKSWVEAAAPPLLCFDREERTRVHDSRTGEAIVHDIGSTGRLVMDSLAAPCSLDRLAARVAHLQGVDAEKEIDALQRRGLVFQEGNRFLGLVLPAGRREAGVAASGGEDKGEAGIPVLKRLSRIPRQVKRRSPGSGNE